MSPRLPALLTALVLAAGAAVAQEAPPPAAAAALADVPVPAPEASDTPVDDPIAALIANLPPDNSTDEVDDPVQTTATTPAPAVTPPAALAAAPAAPRPPVWTPPARPQLDRPVMIGETGVSPDGPPSPVDLGYEARIRASFAAAQGMQGAMDGGWTVRGPDGTVLLVLQLVDRGTGEGLEGAWRDPRVGGIGKVGLIDGIERGSSSLVIRYRRLPDRPQTVLTLTPSVGGWSGEMRDEQGARPVTVERN